MLRFSPFCYNFRVSISRLVTRGIHLNCNYVKNNKYLFRCHSFLFFFPIYIINFFARTLSTNLKLRWNGLLFWPKANYRRKSCVIILISSYWSIRILHRGEVKFNSVGTHLPVVLMFISRTKSYICGQLSNQLWLVICDINKFRVPLVQYGTFRTPRF